MSSRPSSRASNASISRQKSLPGLLDTPTQVCTTNKPPPSPSSSRSTPSPDLTNRNKCLPCLQRRPHTHHQYHNDGRTSPSGAAVTPSAFGGRVRPSIRRLFDEPPSSPSLSPHNNNRNNSSSPRKEGSRSPSIARSVSSMSSHGGDSPKSSTDQRPRWVGAWSSTYTPPPSKSVSRRQSLPPSNNNPSSSSGLDEPSPLLSAYSPTISRQPPRRTETYDSTAKNDNARGRSTSTATACLAAGKGGAFQNKDNTTSPCCTNIGSRRASVCHPIGEDDDCENRQDEGMKGIHSRGGEDGYVAEPTSSHEGSPTTTASSCEVGDPSLDNSPPPLYHIHPSMRVASCATPLSMTTDPTSTGGRSWRFALMPAPPLETSPALIRKFLSAEAITGPCSSSTPSSLSSPSTSGSSYSPLIVTAPAVAAVSPVQFLSKSRVVVTDAAIALNTPGHPLSFALSSSSSTATSTTTPSSTLSSDEKESTPNLLAASLLSYETTTTLLEQDGDDHSSLLSRWQQRSPSPLGQYSVSSIDNNDDANEEYDRSATPTPSGTAGSLRARPSFDSLAAIERPGTPSTCSSPAQELFSRIMDQNNDHINSYSRRHSMGSLVDIVANKARMYLSPSNVRNSMDGSVTPANTNSNSNTSSGSGRRTSSISSTLGYSTFSSASEGLPHRNSISDPLPPLPPASNPPNNANRLPQHQQVVRVSSIESFPRHPSSSSSNLRIQSLRDLFRSTSSTSTTSSSAASVSASSNSNSLTTTPSHSRTPTVETLFDSHHGSNKNSSNIAAGGGGGGRRHSLMDFLPSFSSSSKPPTAAAATLEGDQSTTATLSSSSSSSTITRHRSETNGSATSASTTSSSPCPSPVLRKLGSRSSLSAIAPPLVLPQIKQSPKLAHATLLSLTPAGTHGSSSEASSSSSIQQTNNGSNGTFRRPKCQVLTTTNTTGGNNNRPPPLPSFTVLNEIWMDPTTNTLHQLPGVLLTPSHPFPLPTLPPSTSSTSLASATTASTTSHPSAVATASTNGPTDGQQGPGGQPESVEWPWTHMNPTDRDKWPTAFHISAQHGGILALPPTYSPGSELDEVSALSLSRTHSNMGVMDYGSSVMEARRYFGNGGGGESVPSSLAGSRVSAGAGSLYYDETLGQTPYGNGYFHGPLGQHGQPAQFVPTYTYHPTA